jgi:peptidoglycan/LPS O-acetylase OafA/YrhL
LWYIHKTFHHDFQNPATHLRFLQKFDKKLFAPVINVPAALQSSYFPALDGLRGVAVLFVLLAHIGVNIYLHPYGFYLDSTIGVHIFFVISGFLITTLLLKEKVKNGRISLRYFYIRRVLRILPVAYLFLLILIVLNHFYHLKIPATDFIASFFFYKNLPMHNEPYTAHFWSLAVEEQFYLTFPIILALNTNRYMMLALAIVIIVPAVSVMGYYNVSFLNNNAVGHLISKVSMYAFWKGPVIILIGSVFSIIIFKGIVKPEQIKANSFLSFALLVMAITISTKTFVFYSKYASEYLSSILIAFAIILTINRQCFLSAILCTSFFRRIGMVSYSIYIWQELFIGSRAGEPWLHAFSSYPVWAVMILKLIIISLVVSLSYRFESVFLKIKSKFSYNC